ncbi:hypothetical protein Sango_0470000 [Sesamum angolense]|uniref:Hydrolase family protein / HAD-superfamily protein n=1 Tax=Sesamum angolense TaxID=2727404 RepID=A0AAE2C519_9LAMI|nr:hypothetical protein Sango_0470000 [Sesamum angolense]
MSESCSLRYPMSVIFCLVAVELSFFVSLTFTDHHGGVWFIVGAEFSLFQHAGWRIGFIFLSASFGIAFDIDGVILRGDTPIGGSPQALKRLYDDSGALRIPYVFLTNGGGVPESKRATELSKLLGAPILPSQVIQGHSPFKQLVDRFQNELIIAVGKGEPATVMSEYGFKNVLSIDEYASYFKHIDPLGQFKNWTKHQAGYERSSSREVDRKNDPCSQRVQAVFIVSDSVDWSRDIQVLCDILSTGGLPGREISSQPPLYFANDDLSYQGLFPTERLGMGAFRIALESIYNRVYPNALEYTSYGKPNPSVFKNAENAGQPWFSILTRSGVFKGKDNHPLYPAEVVDTVEEAVDYILSRETSQPHHSP